MSTSNVLEPTEHTRTQVIRFPRLAVSAEANTNPDLAVLEDLAFRLIARRRELRIELGRTFIQIKSTLKHGRWETYYDETFAMCGVCLSTAQRYMKLARKADTDSKNGASPLFEPATDSQAVEVRDATAKAEAELGNRQRAQARVDGIFKLPLLLTIEEQKATRELMSSPDWPGAHKTIIALLNQLNSKFRTVKHTDN